MHSTKAGPSHSEWPSELPCMRRRLTRIRVVLLLVHPVLQLTVLHYASQ